MRLTELRIGNFKAFGGTQRVPIRPLTLIFGPNSAGKSSLVHAMALLHEAARTGSFEVNDTAIGGLSIDLGGFGQYVHRRDTDLSVHWGATFSVDGSPDQARGLPAQIGLDLAIGRQRVRAGFETTLTSYELSDDHGALLEIGPPRKPWNVHLENPSLLWHALHQFPSAVLGDLAGLSGEQSARLDTILAEAARLKEALESGKPTTGPDFSEWKTATLEGLATRLRKTSRAERVRQDPRATLSSLLPAGVRVRAGNKSPFQEGAVWYLDWASRRANEYFHAALGDLRYLGPLRLYPPRHLSGMPEGPEWQAAGGAAWDVLRADTGLREAVNRWLASTERLHTKYRIQVSRYVSAERVKQRLHSSLRKLGAGDNTLPQGLRAIERVLDEVVDSVGKEGLSEIRLLDQGSNTVVSHRDVGVGISQLLPILVSSYEAEHKLIAIEQPELHLHPALQAELADLFIESSLGPKSNTFLLETHSEHLLLRILRRVRQTSANRLPDGKLPVRPSDLSVLYVRGGEAGAEVIDLPVTDDGDFLEDWPDGFFPERSEELFG